MRWLLWKQRRRGQARLSIHFEQHEAAWASCGIVIAEIRSRRAAATERTMRGERDAHRGSVSLGMNHSRDHVARSALGIFRLVIIEALARDDLSHGKRAISHHPDGQLPAGNVFLDQ